MLMQKACFAKICQNNALIIGLKPGRFQAFKGFFHWHHNWLPIKIPNEALNH
jgi:hypothetical protein